MTVNNSYPNPAKKSDFLHYFRLIARIIFSCAAVACPIINLLCGGKAWSVVVLWAIYTVFPIVCFPLVGNNLISQGVRLALNVAVLLALIDYFLASGWAELVVPIVMSASLAVLACLYFTDLRRHRHDVMPLVLALLASILLAVVFELTRGSVMLPMLIMGLVAVALLIAIASTMGGELLREIRKYFHTT